MTNHSNHPHILTHAKKKHADSKEPEKVADFELKTDKKNQLLAFLKPEVFFDQPEEMTEKIVQLVLDKFKEFDVEVNGAAVYTGESLNHHQIMDRHYGVINTLSKNASRVLSQEDKAQAFANFGITDPEAKLLGGHEVLEAFPNLDPEQFELDWLSVGSYKIRGGHYFRHMDISGEKVVVVNGFHPKQLRHYTAPNRKLFVMLVSSNTPWKTLRDEMIGDTFPHKALETSIRGKINRQAKEFGFEDVTIANNIIHLSAGPSEALFEMHNFLAVPFGVDVFKDAKLAVALREAGFTDEEIKAFTTDKKLHEELELKDTDEAVEIIKKRKISN